MILGLSGIPFLTLFDGIPLAHDLPDHLAYSRQFENGWSEGVIYPRWHAELNYGWGEPTGVFYPPLLYSFTSAINKLFQPGLLVSLFIALGLFSFIGTLGVFLLGKTLGSLKAAWLAALLFVLFPFRYFELHASGLFSQFAASNFLPWLILCLWRIQRSTSSDSLLSKAIPLALTYALIILTNLPLAVMSTYLIAAWFIGSSLLKRSIGLLFPTLVGGLIGVGISSVYLLPAILELPHLHIPHSESTPLYQSNFIFQSEGSWMAEGLQSLFQRLGIFSILPFASALIFLLLAYKLAKSTIRQGVYFLLLPLLIFSVFSFFLLTPSSEFLWQYLPFLQQVNMPWRFLSVLSAPGAVLAAWVCVEILALFIKAQWKLTVNLVTIGVLIPLILGIGVIYFLLNNSIEDMNGRGKLSQEPALLRSFTQRTAFFLPKDAGDPEQLKTHPMVIVKTPGTEVQVEEQTPHKRTFRVKGDEVSQVVFRIFHFPGWVAECKTHSETFKLEVKKDPAHGRIALSIPEGEHEIVLRFEDTLSRLAGWGISLLSLLLTGVGAFMKKGSGVKEVVNEEKPELELV